MTAWWKHCTLRFRLALWYGIGGTVLLAGFSATVYVYVARRMASPLNLYLKQDLAEIQARLAVSADNGIFWDGHEIAANAIWDSRDPWFELWDEEGRLVRRCWPFTEDRLDRVPAAPVRGSDTLSVFRIAADLPMRVFSTPFQVPGHPGAWMIRVMRIHEPVADALRALLAIIAVSLPVVIALLVTGGYLLTRHWLKPLEQMVRRAEGITAENLGLRLPVINQDDELGQLGMAFNQTLARLEDSFLTLDRFVADASHELRTPLTTLRSVGEVGLRRSRTVEEYREIIGSMLEEAHRLHQLVERLLALASAEGGAKTAHLEELRLDHFTTACVNELVILAENKNQRLVITTAACHVCSDPVLLRQALQNLVDNAVKYSPEGATIRVTVETRAGECVIAVQDEGPGIPPEQLARLADRFFRVEDSRQRASGGFGLGLAITKAYLRVLGGRLECVPARPKGSCFSLILPDSPGT